MGKIKEFFNKHKRIRRLLVALVLFAAFFVGFCFGYTAQTVKEQGKGTSGTATIRASAERAATEETRTIYPSENLIPYPYAKTTITLSGVTFTDNGDGTITANGTATKTAIFVFRNFDFTLPTGVYSVNGVENGSAGSYCLQISRDKYSQSWNVCNGSIQIELKSTSSILLQAVVYEGITVHDIEFKPMLNIGTVAYPFVPNLDGVRQEGYEEGESAGHEAGKQEGYDEGYKDASDTLNLGVLYGATVSGKFSYTNGQTVTLTNGKPDFSYNGLNFNSIWGKYYHYNNDTENTLESVEMTLNFKTPFQYDGFPLYFLGDSDVMSATFISTANKRYHADIEKYNDTAIGEDYALIRIWDAEKEEGIEVKALTIYFGRAVDTLYNANVISKSGGYLNGYDNGYNAGFSNGKTEGHIEGRNEGYDKGKTEGYEVGYNEGVTQQMTSSVGTFFKSIYSVFDINIFGPIKIGHFIFIPLVLSLLLIILKLFRG